ncbi:hypothetical protein SPRA44_600133 [Serratia proteamaculans]|nr:hypothetical protein SPRA44_600133 [Serratia proteamaculans]
MKSIVWFLSYTLRVIDVGVKNERNGIK